MKELEERRMCGAFRPGNQNVGAGPEGSCAKTAKDKKQ